MASSHPSPFKLSLHSTLSALVITTFSAGPNFWMCMCRWVDYARWVGVQKDSSAAPHSAIEHAAAAIEGSTGVTPA